jgi:hypothetical protein
MRVEIQVKSSTFAMEIRDPVYSGDPIFPKWAVNGHRNFAFNVSSRAGREAYISLNVFDGPFANAKSLMAKNVEIPARCLRKMLCVFSALLLLSILKYNPDKAARRMNLIGVC